MRQEKGKKRGEEKAKRKIKEKLTKKNIILMSIVRHLRCVYSTTLHLLPDPNIQSILIFVNLITKPIISMYFSHHYFQI